MIGLYTARNAIRHGRYQTLIPYSDGSTGNTLGIYLMAQLLPVSFTRTSGGSAGPFPERDGDGSKLPTTKKVRYKPGSTRNPYGAYTVRRDQSDGATHFHVEYELSVLGNLVLSIIHIRPSCGRKIYG